MNYKHRIDLFPPLRYMKTVHSDDYLDTMLNKRMHYVSKGRYAIVHILKSQGICDGKVLISSYMCPTVDNTLRHYGYEVDYYDIEAIDLNPNLDDIASRCEQSKPEAIIVPSMYGNPADLLRINNYCDKHQIIMIDDAAQSFGATLEDKFVGTFGNGGFISFSPGKPTSGHLGGYFWSNNEIYTPVSQHHLLRHYLLYFDFLLNRYNSYNNPFLRATKLLTILNSRLDMNSLFNDCICDFEKSILHGIIDSNISATKGFRKKYSDSFVSCFANTDKFRILRCVRGEPNNCKIVLVFQEEGDAEKTANFLLSKRIKSFLGYDLPSWYINGSSPVAQSLIGKILELPIEDDSYRMEYLFDSVSQSLYLL